MFEWLRKIPHPKYGKCGGASRDCSVKPPLDDLDLAFEKHDNELFEASIETNPIKQKTMRQIADKNLAIRLRSIKSKNLKWQGRVYRRMAMMVFRG